MGVLSGSGSSSFLWRASGHSEEERRGENLVSIVARLKNSFRSSLPFLSTVRSHLGLHKRREREEEEEILAAKKRREGGKSKEEDEI